MEFVKVGRLNKAFGTKGQIKVISDEVYEDDLLGAEIWFVEKSGGYVPYFVESAELGNNFLVKFEDIPSPEAAKSITGAHLYLRAADIKRENDAETFLEKLVGYSIYDSDIKIGEIIRIEEFPQQLMAIIPYNSKEVLIPLLPEFILDIDNSSKKILMELPIGMIASQM